ncbi:MAG: hypothetical protein ACYS6K_22810 [Planctomycetota bacterium]
MNRCTVCGEDINTYDEGYTWFHADLILRSHMAWPMFVGGVKVWGTADIHCNEKTDDDYSLMGE